MRYVKYSNNLAAVLERAVGTSEVDDQKYNERREFVRYVRRTLPDMQLIYNKMYDEDQWFTYRIKYDRVRRDCIVAMSGKVFKRFKEIADKNLRDYNFAEQVKALCNNCKVDIKNVTYMGRPIT